MASFSSNGARLARLKQEYEDLRRQWQSPDGENLDTLLRLNYVLEHIEESEASDDEQLIA